MNELVLISALGAAQGLLLGALLASQPYNRQPANRWLAAFVLTFALLTVGDVLEDSGYILAVPHLAHLFDGLIFLLGPLYYQYQRHLTQSPPITRYALLFHTLPALLLLLQLLPFYCLSTAEKIAIIEGGMPLVQTGHDVSPILLLAALQMLVYWIIGAIQLRDYARRLEQNYSSIERLNFNWLQLLLRVSIGLWLVWLVALLTASPLASGIDALGFPVVVYTLGYLGLRQPQVFTGQLCSFDSITVTTNPFFSTDSASTMSVNNDKSQIHSHSAKYAKSGLNNSRATLYLNRLDELMQTEKPYLENELTLPELAGRLNISTQHLSQLLNDRLGQTFFEFINRRRVEEVKRCFSDPAYATESILAIALAAGFSSKAAFNAAFKRYTGQTPSQYRWQKSH